MGLRRASVFAILLASISLSGCIPTPIDLVLDQVGQAADVRVTATTREATCTASSPFGLDSVTRVIISSDEPNGQLDELVARDPEFAKKAGFPRPILHGMCTYGITCRGVLQTYADYDAGAFKQHAVRFSSPVYPGETVTMDMWKDGNVISFEARVKSRNVTVIKSGRTVLG